MMLSLSMRVQVICRSASLAYRRFRYDSRFQTWWWPATADDTTTSYGSSEADGAATGPWWPYGTAGRFRICYGSATTDAADAASSADGPKAGSTVVCVAVSSATTDAAGVSIRSSPRRSVRATALWAAAGATVGWPTSAPARSIVTVDKFNKWYVNTPTCT